MSPRDTTHAYDLGRCLHLSALDRADGLTCPSDQPDRTPGDSDRHTPTSPQAPRLLSRAAVTAALLAAVVLSALLVLLVLTAAQTALCAVNGQQAHSYCPEFTADRQEPRP